MCVKAAQDLFTPMIILMGFVFFAHFNGAFSQTQILPAYYFTSDLMGSTITQLDSDSMMQEQGR